MSLTLPTHLSLYIHLPWCIKKCPYCDFNSHQLRGELDEHQYVTALLIDLKAEVKNLGRKVSISSIFIGGGTPSLFSCTEINRLLDGVRQCIELSADSEITMEANPGAADQARFEGFRQAGVNRLSIGIQSFNCEHLSALGRVHDSEQAINAVLAAKQAGFNNFNLDLMYSLPHQTITTALADVLQAIELEPTHISAYQLTIEPNTLFAHQPPELPDDETQWAIQNNYSTQLKKAGYKQYEISAYAKPNKQCQHNINYWRYGDYIGIGAGAHGKLTTPKGVKRTHKPKHPQAYLRMMCGASPIMNNYITEIKLIDLPLEFMMNQLRLNETFCLTAFEKSTGLNRRVICKAINQAKDRGLLLVDNERIGVSPHGRLFLDDILQLFLPENQDTTNLRLDYAMD